MDQADVNPESPKSASAFCSQSAKSEARLCVSSSFSCDVDPAPYHSAVPRKRLCASEGIRDSTDADLHCRIQVPPDGSLNRKAGERRLPSNPARATPELGYDGRAPDAYPVSRRCDVERYSSKEATMKKLITDAQRAQLLVNGAAHAQGERLDPLPVVKLFTPDAHATWLLTELDPADGDTAFGLCDLGLCTPALGTVRLSDLETIRGPGNLSVQRDLHFTPRFTLSEYTRRAQADGSIND
jgi:hypothetical protein